MSQESIDKRAAGREMIKKLAEQKKAQAEALLKLLSEDWRKFNDQNSKASIDENELQQIQARVAQANSFIQNNPSIKYIVNQLKKPILEASKRIEQQRNVEEREKVIDRHEQQQQKDANRAFAMIVDDLKIILTDKIKNVERVLTEERPNNIASRALEKLAKECMELQGKGKLSADKQEILTKITGLVTNLETKIRDFYGSTAKAKEVTVLVQNAQSLANQPQPANNPNRTAAVEGYLKQAQKLKEVQTPQESKKTEQQLDQPLSPRGSMRG